MGKGNSAENMGLFRCLAMNMAAVVDLKRGLASVRRTVTSDVAIIQFASKLG